MQQEAAGQSVLETVAARLHRAPGKAAAGCVPPLQPATIAAQPAIACQQMADPAPLTEVSPPGGEGPWSYQWQRRTTTTPWVAIDNAINVFYDPPPADYHEVFFRRMDLNVCGVVYSNEVAIPLTEPAPLVITAPIKGPPAGSSGEEVVFEVPPVPGALQYEWTASAGTITGGQGTPRLTLKLPATDRETALQLTVAAVSTCSPGPAAVVGVVCRPVAARPAPRKGYGKRLPVAPYRAVARTR